MLFKKRKSFRVVNMLLILACLFSLVLTQTISASNTTKDTQTQMFIDVPGDQWYTSYVNNLAELNIVKGFDDGTYRPGKNATRAEFVTIMDRVISTYANLSSNKGIFTDVKDGEWYTTYIEDAFNKGIIKGYGDGTFAPEDNITRAEVVSIVANAIAINEGTTVEELANRGTRVLDFSDLTWVEVDTWWYDAFIVCVDFGIISGYPDGTLQPLANITRAEMAIIISRFCGQTTVTPEPSMPIISGLFNSMQEVESMTNGQLLNLATQEEQYSIPGFYYPDDFGVKLIYGEWWQDVSNSVTTADEAKNEVESLALMQNPASYTIKYIGENNYYYVYQLTYSSKNITYTYTVRVVVYKDSAKHCTFDSHNGYEAEIRSLDADSVIKLLDLEVCLRGGYSSPIYRQFEETNDKYIYTYYSIYTVGGDWNMSDYAVLKMREITVDKKTGKYITKHQALKSVEIPGTYHPNPM